MLGICVVSIALVAVLARAQSPAPRAFVGVGVRALDGKPLWRYRPVANDTANIATPVFFDNEALAEANPAAYREKGRFKIADQGLPSWAHPVVAGAQLYIRNQRTLAVYDVHAK